MGNGNGVIQAELTVELGQFLAALNQAQAALAKYAQGAGSSMGAANQATALAAKGTDSLAKAAENYKAGQVSQARTVNYFVKELTDVTGMSKEAASAVGGLGQVMLEAAAGGSAFAVGFEAVKFLVTQLVGIFQAAEERVKELGNAGMIATAGLVAGMDALVKVTAAVPTAGGKAFAEVFAAGTRESEKLSESIEKLRPTRWSQISAFIWDGAQGIKRVNDEFEQAAAKLGKMVEDAKAFATAAGDAVGGYEESPEQEKRYWEIKAADAEKARIDGKARAADQLKLVYENLANEMQRLADEEDRAVTVQAKRLLDLKKEADDAIIESVRQDELSGAFSGYETPGGLGEGEKELARLNDEGRQTTQIFSAIGESIGSAFGSIGEIVGGAAGTFMNLVGRMIQQAVQLAISLAAASVAWTSPLGMVAIGSVALAGLLGLLSAVPSFDVGTLSVPRTGLAMVHRGEAILPAGGPAETYRAGLARMGGGGGNVTVHVKMDISALDGQSVYRTLTGSRDQLARVVREAVRDGVMG